MTDGGAQGGKGSTGEDWGSHDLAVATRAQSKGGGGGGGACLEGLDWGGLRHVLGPEENM